VYYTRPARLCRNVGEAKRERTRWVPIDGELWPSRTKPEETLVEARSESDVGTNRSSNLGIAAKDLSIQSIWSVVVPDGIFFRIAGASSSFDYRLCGRNVLNLFILKL